MSYSESDAYTIETVTLADHFLMTPNSLWEDETLSFSAKGLLGYLLSRPKNWKVHPWQLADVYKGDKRGNGLDSIKSMIKELRAAGYIAYSKIHDPITGRWIHKYKVYPLPIRDFQKKFPEVVKPPVGEPAVVKPPYTTSTELTSNITNVCIVPESPAVRKCEKFTSSGSKILVSFQDLISRSIQEKKEWSMPEIEESWSIFEKYSHPVNDWFGFIEGTIKKIRIKQHNTKQETMKCKNASDPHAASMRRKGNYSEKDMSAPILANFARQIGLSIPS